MQPDITVKSPLADGDYLLMKFSGKGGWTFAIIPEITKDKHGWVRVSGTIDGYEITNSPLYPTGNGIMCLPVKAEIRKKIGKNEGDKVHIILFSENLPVVGPDDFMTCLQEDPIAYQNFHFKPQMEQQAIIDWIYSTNTDQVRVERIADTLNKLTR